MIPVEIALVVLWLALSLVNRAALLLLFILLLDVVTLNHIESNTTSLCITAATCFIVSSATITPNYLRAPLLAAGSAYWVGALDELLYNTLAISTAYYALMPYLIITINAYIAAVLFNRGGLQHVGITKRHPRLVNRRWLGL